MAVAFYLDLTAGSINGESTVQKNQIDVLSWSWGASQPVSLTGVGGHAAGKPNVQDLTIMKVFDKSTVSMLSVLMKGTPIKTGILTGYKSIGSSKPGVYLKVTMTNMYVTSVQDSASSENPTESVSFAYQAVKIEYFTQDPSTGALTAAGVLNYDVTTNATT
jgi:type VI secretion system secreted protein Hcp